MFWWGSSNSAPVHLGMGHCVDDNNRRPAHCWGVLGSETVCRDLCMADAACFGYEYGQNYGGILCQLLYANIPHRCPDYRLHIGYGQGAIRITKTFHNTGGQCYAKTSTNLGKILATLAKLKKRKQNVNSYSVQSMPSLIGSKSILVHVPFQHVKATSHNHVKV